MTETTTTYAFIAFRTEDEDEEFRVTRTVGAVPPEFAENQKLVNRNSVYPLLLRNGQCFAVVGWSRKNQPIRLPDMHVWMLGLLWELETTEAHHDRLLSNLFHEIRNPVCGILNTTSLLLQKPDLGPALRKSITTIEDSTSTLLQLSSDLLEIHRLKQNVVELKWAPVVLRHACQSVTDLLHNPMTFRIHLAIHHQVPCWLWLDETRFKQILFNLLNNSQKYGSSTATIRCAWQPPQLYFEVEDDGHGIPKSEFRHIFRLQTNSESGLGIGLLMCKKLLRLMKGDIFVKRSELNEGTTMAFFLETKVAEMAPPVSPRTTITPRSPVAGLTHQKVLIADDNRSVRESFREMVHHVAGPEIIVDLAENGVEAVLKQEQRHYDILFMDLRMPQLRGLEAIFQILMSNGPYPAYIFVVSAYALSPEEKDVCQKWELAGFIQKPFKIEDLRQIFLRIQKAAK